MTPTYDGDMTVNEREATRKALARIFPLDPDPCEPSDVDDLLGDEGAIADPSHHRMFVPRTDDARRIAADFIAHDGSNLADKASAVLGLDLPGGLALFSLDYLTDVLKVFEAHADHVAVRTGDDMPMVLESDHFTVALAPRIADDDYENQAEWL